MAKADREIRLPQAGDTWIPRRAHGAVGRVERVLMRSGVDAPIVEVLHLPGRILHERRLVWFLQNYHFQRAAGTGEG